MSSQTDTLLLSEAFCMDCGHGLHMRRTSIFTRTAEVRRVAKAHNKSQPTHVVELLTGEEDVHPFYDRF